VSKGILITNIPVRNPAATGQHRSIAAGDIFTRLNMRLAFLAGFVFCYTTSMATQRNLIVTHHAPDLDAITSVWLLKKWAGQDYADAQVAFVNPGATISDLELEALGFTPAKITHVDTGLGEFDHHQAEKVGLEYCASSLVHDYLCQLHPELKNDLALQEIVKFVLQIDHFREIDWPNPSDLKYEFMIHEIIAGLEAEQLHDDDSQLHFGMTCLDGIYHALKNRLEAEQKIKEKGIFFKIKAGRAMAIATGNDDTLKLAQLTGCVLAIKKDSHSGNIRIKARPDADLDLKALHEAILERDQVGDWFYHNSGKMLLNGSRKKAHTSASPLALKELISLVKKIYG